MKTSSLEVREMLSVLSVDEVEKRFVDVPGVKSATVNYAAGSVTVRYDETRLRVADIKAIVHQRGHQSASDSHKAARKSAEVPAPPPEQASVPTLAAVVPKASPMAPAGDGAKNQVPSVAHPAAPAAVPAKAPAVSRDAPPAPRSPTS